MSKLIDGLFAGLLLTILIAVWGIMTFALATLYGLTQLSECLS